MKVKKISLIGAGTALSVILGYVEYLIPFNFGIPGIKLGLSNLATVVFLYLFDAPAALFVSVVRISVSSLLFGTPLSFLYSVTGGILSFISMYLLKKTGKFSVVGVSALGGAVHNAGQLAVAAAVFSSLRVAYYLPVLLPVGALTGALIGFASDITVKRLKKIK